MFEIGPLVLEKIFKSCQCNFTILQLSPLGKGNMALHLNKLKSPSPMDALCHVCLKLVVFEKKLKIETVYRQTEGQTDGQQVIRKAQVS